MIRFALLAAMAAALPLAAAPAQDPAGDETPAAEKKICKREIATGSIMSKRVCHTKAEWDALSARSRSDLERQRTQERARQNIQDNR